MLISGKIALLAKNSLIRSKRLIAYTLKVCFHLGTAIIVFYFCTWKVFFFLFNGDKKIWAIFDIFILELLSTALISMKQNWIFWWHILLIDWKMTCKAGIKSPDLMFFLMVDESDKEKFFDGYFLRCTYIELQIKTSWSFSEMVASC